MKGKKQSKTRI